MSAGNTLRSLLELASPEPVDFATLDSAEWPNYSRSLLEYEGREGDPIRAHLFEPAGVGPFGAVLVFHQHAGEFHLGKSEVAGDVGDSLQAFGPALAERGVVVLAPDAITFEDRRANRSGVESHEDDWLQHYNAMAYRLVNGDHLMRKCLDDAQRAFSVLLAQPNVDPQRAGTFGHSYGGTTALHHAAVDPRPTFVGLSGAAASLAERQRRGTGINMFELVPGLAKRLDADDLVRAVAPRPLLMVSATDDPYSVDAHDVVERAASGEVTNLRVEGGHALDQDRHDAIVTWLVARATGA